MLDLKKISLEDDEVPLRPSWITPPTPVAATSIDEAIAEIIESGKPVVFGGISLIGAKGYIVTEIGMTQIKDGNPRGWFLSLGHPDKDPPDFVYADPDHPLDDFPFPNTITYFVGVGDEQFLEKDAPQEELEAMARFVLAFISDSGPPEGIDWPTSP